MERVVITGMGAITPVGNDVPSFWESLKTGKCGIGPITKFDVSDFKILWVRGCAWAARP